MRLGERVRSAHGISLRQRVRDVAALGGSLLKESGGATVDILHGDCRYLPFFAVGLQGETKVLTQRHIGRSTIEAFIFERIRLLTRPEHALGLWRQTGIVEIHVDVVRLIPTYAMAMDFGRANSQLAIFDLRDLREYPCNGETYESSIGGFPVRAEEFSQGERHGSRLLDVGSTESEDEQVSQVGAPFDLES